MSGLRVLAAIALLAPVRKDLSAHVKGFDLDAVKVFSVSKWPRPVLETPSYFVWERGHGLIDALRFLNASQWNASKAARVTSISISTLIGTDCMLYAGHLREIN